MPRHERVTGYSSRRPSHAKETQGIERASTGGDHEPAEPTGAAMNVYSESTVTFFVTTIRYRRFLHQCKAALVRVEILS
jgi:hypothetical protein